MGIEEEFDIEIPAETAEQVTTVEDAVETVSYTHLEINYHRAERELNNMKELLLNGEKAEHIPCKLRTDFQPLFNLSLIHISDL